MYFMYYMYYTYTRCLSLPYQGRQMPHNAAPRHVVNGVSRISKNDPCKQASSRNTTRSQGIRKKPGKWIIMQLCPRPRRPSATRYHRGLSCIIIHFPCFLRIFGTRSLYCDYSLVYGRRFLKSVPPHSSHGVAPHCKASCLSDMAERVTINI